MIYFIVRRIICCFNIVHQVEQTYHQLFNFMLLATFLDLELSVSLTRELSGSSVGNPVTYSEGSIMYFSLISYGSTINCGDTIKSWHVYPIKICQYVACVSNDYHELPQ